jgi:dolichyl-phosphate-mannose-protein mannosyltransferase
LATEETFAPRAPERDRWARKGASAADILNNTVVARTLLTAGAVLIVLFVAHSLGERWVPEDDGSFGQSAQRVLSGEMPHRDFVDLYTGGLTFLNAGMFAVFGENLIWLRVPLFVLFLAFVPTFYWIARRYAPMPVAALMVLLVVGWGIPLYPAAMPSWYLLFFATFGAACLLRYLDSGRTRWLMLAGVFGGLSLTFKITGIWYVLAVLLFLVFVEQESRGRRQGGGSRPGASTLLVGGFALAVGGFVASVLKTHFGGAEIVNLFLPVLAVCAAVVANESAVATTVGLRRRAAAVARMVFPFLAGVAAPIVVFCIPFVVTGAIGDLVDGVFVSPQSRLDTVYMSTPHPAYVLSALPIVLLFVARRRVRPSIRRWLDITFVIVAATLLLNAREVGSYRIIWLWAQSGAALVGIFGAAALLLAWRGARELPDRRPVMLLLALAAFASLVQFPFAETIYLCYALPLLALAALASIRYAEVHRGVVPTALLLALVVFGFVWLERSPQTLGSQYAGPLRYVVLDSSRASIRVLPSDRRMYREITRLLQTHSTGPYTYAGPDTPEIYYLADLRNPTRSLFDFLDRSGSARGPQLLETLRRAKVTAIAIDTDPAHSDPHEPYVLSALRTRYPHGTRVGRIEVRWQ